MLEKIRDIFVVVGGGVAAATFVFSVVSGYYIDREHEIRNWQKAYVFQLLSQTANQPMTFSQIQDSFQDAGDVHLQFDIPKRELHPSATRRVLLELISDGTLVQYGTDNFAINVQDGESQQLLELVKISDKLVENEQRKSNERQVQQLQKALIHEIMANSAQSDISLEGIRSEYTTKAAALDILAPTVSRMNLLETRRIMLELIDAGVVMQTTRDKFAVSVPSAERVRIIRDFGDIVKENQTESVKSARSLLREHMQLQGVLVQELFDEFKEVIETQQRISQEQQQESLQQSLKSNAKLTQRIEEMIKGQHNASQEMEKNRLEEQKRRWEKVIIFEIIASEGGSAVEFDHIRNIYDSRRSIYEKYGIPKIALDRAQTRLALLDLVSNGVLVQTEQDAFAIDPKKSQMERFMEMSDLQKESVTSVRRNR